MTIAASAAIITTSSTWRLRSLQPSGLLTSFCIPYDCDSGRNSGPGEVDDDCGLREGETGFNGRDMPTTSRVITLTVFPGACTMASGGQPSRFEWHAVYMHGYCLDMYSTVPTYSSLLVETSAVSKTLARAAIDDRLWDEGARVCSYMCAFCNGLACLVPTWNYCSLPIQL